MKKVKDEISKELLQIERYKAKTDLYNSRRGFYKLIFNKTNSFLATIIILSITNPDITKLYLNLIYNDLLKYSIIIIGIVIIIMLIAGSVYMRYFFNSTKKRIGEYVKVKERNDANNQSSGLNERGGSTYDTVDL